MADTKIVSIVLGGMLLWAVLLVASYADNESNASTVTLALKTATDNNSSNNQPN